jgi:hypothetical protein
MKTAALVASVLLLSCLLAAQDENRFDASFSGAGVFSKTSNSSNGTGVSLKPTNSFALVGSFRYRFTRVHSVQVNFAHTRNSQMFTVPPDLYRIMSSITEFSGAYVFTRNLTRFCLRAAACCGSARGTRTLTAFKTRLAQRSKIL